MYAALVLEMDERAATRYVRTGKHLMDDVPLDGTAAKAFRCTEPNLRYGATCVNH